MTQISPNAPSRSAGSLWVDRFLQPRLKSRFPNSESIGCLQISPEDSTEAERLRELGHPCTMTEPTPSMELLFADGTWDFAFTGQFTTKATDRPGRIKLAAETRRVLRAGGSLLLAVGNRLCPLDLTRNGKVFHGPEAPRCVSLGEISNILIDEAGFSSVELQNVNGHFGWGSVPGAARHVGSLLDFYWRYFATPSRKWLYASPFNPTLLLWFNK